MRTCDYCPWPAVARIELKGFVRALLGRAAVERFVCGKHLRGGRHG
jgi:hypothetical protein